MDDQRDHSRVSRLDLIAALAPFAAEGRKWALTPPVFDGLRLLCAEDYGLLNRSSREAEFTIGDLKRAADVFAALTAGIAEV